MGVVKAHEPMCVQAFCPKFAIERFDEGIVGGFARTKREQCQMGSFAGQDLFSYIPLTLYS
jgi:hypothetical protein